MNDDDQTRMDGTGEDPVSDMNEKEILDSRDERN